MSGVKEDYAIVLSQHDIEVGAMWTEQPGVLANRVGAAVMGSMDRLAVAVFYDQQEIPLIGATVFHVYRIRLPEKHYAVIADRGFQVSYPVEGRIGAMVVTKTAAPESSFGVVTLEYRSLNESEKSEQISVDIAFFTGRLGIRYWIPTVLTEPSRQPIELYIRSRFWEFWVEVLLELLPNYIHTVPFDEQYKPEELTAVSVEGVADSKYPIYAFEPKEVIVLDNNRIHSLFRYLGRSTKDGQHVALVEAAKRLSQFVAEAERFWLVDKGRDYLVIAKCKAT